MAQQDGWQEETSPFHAGEQFIQEKLGKRDVMEGFGRRVVRPWMPDQHRDFYGALPMLVVGSIDAEGWPWASLIFGKPGFISSPDETTLDIAAAPLVGDPLAANVADGSPIGLLGIELGSRRRNRVNGRLRGKPNGSMTFAVDQSFGNCPQYIQTRGYEFVRDPAAGFDGAVETLPALDAAAAAQIAAADTFFVASYVPTKSSEKVEGCDVSHRGGRPGFVKVEGSKITIPDYLGNNHFNTLGNFHLNPRAGLLFPDFETGDLLFVAGKVDIIWDGPEIEYFAGAERAWSVDVTQVRRIRGGMPMRWTLEEYAPTSKITGTWPEARAQRAAAEKRSAWRPMRVAKITDESEVIRSFTFIPEDGEPLLPFKAGQYLTIRVAPSDCQGKTVMRTYTVSSAPGDPYYRISVKKEGPRETPEGAFPPGLVSNHLHDTLKEGDVIEAKAPMGDFFIDASVRRPAVLLSGGVGVTPMMAMARHIEQENIRTRYYRPTTVIHSAQTSGQRPFAAAFTELAERSGGRMRYISLLERPEAGLEPGKDYHGVGRITPEVLQRVLPIDDYDFFLCGPPPFMQGLYDTLRDLGVSDRRIFAEAFGPASMKRRPDEGSAPAFQPGAEAEAAVVTFSKSGFEQQWNKGDTSLLELAEAHGVTPDYGCRSGSCGSCATRLKAGKVAYRSEPTADVAEDEVLICCAVPAEGCDALDIEL